MFEDEGETLYLHSGPVTDSRKGGHEESVLELVKLEDGVGSMGGCSREAPAQTLWQRNGMSKSGVYSLWIGVWTPTSCSNWD